MKFNDIIQTIGKALGKRKTSTVSIPFWLVMPVAAALGGFSLFPVTVDQLKMLGQGNVCPEDEYKDVFGIKPWAFTYQNLFYLKGWK
jgi:NADH dehydrogenase